MTDVIAVLVSLTCSRDGRSLSLLIGPRQDRRQRRECRVRVQAHKHAAIAPRLVQTRLSQATIGHCVYTTGVVRPSDSFDLTRLPPIVKRLWHLGHPLRPPSPVSRNPDAQTSRALPYSRWVCNQFRPQNWRHRPVHVVDCPRLVRVATTAQYM
jgi:hypothetical protein